MTTDKGIVIREGQEKRQNQIPIVRKGIGQLNQALSMPIRSWV